MAGKYRGRKPVSRKPKGKYVKKKKVKMVPRKPIAYSAEVFQLRLGEINQSLAVLSGSSSNGPKNSVILLPAGIHHGTTCTTSEGITHNLHSNWLKPVYQFSSKCRLDFSGLADHADTYKGLKFRVMYGVMKIAPDKYNATVSSLSGFEAAVLAELKKELYESEISSDYLEYTRKNRNIRIDGKFDVKPNLMASPSLNHVGVTATTPTYAPVRCFTIRHPVPKMKCRVSTLTHGVSPQITQPLLNHLWTPWVLIMGDQLTANTGHVNVSHTSRMYFTDV